MSFTLYTGLMGGGKSYAVVEAILQAAKEGAIVHTNMPLEQEAWEELGLWDKIVKLPKDPSGWIRFEKKKDEFGNDEDVPTSDIITGGAEGSENIVAIDEASLIFRTKDQAKNKDKHQPVFDLVALSRHVGLEIIFIAQHEENVSADLRRLAQLKVKCIKVKDLPVIGPLVYRLFGDFVRGCYKGMSRHLEYRTWHRFRPEVGKLYRTHGEAKSVGMRVESTRKVSGTSASTRKGIFLFVVLPVLLVGLVVWMGFRMKTQIYGKQETEQTAKAKPATKGTTAQPEEKQADAPKPKAGMREVEWHPADELILAIKITGKRGPVIYTRDSQKLQIGGAYEGQEITQYQQHAGWHYFTTALGRVVVVRPITATERQALPPVTIQGQRPESVAASLDVGNGVGSGVSSALGFIGGNQ